MTTPAPALCACGQPRAVTDAQLEHLRRYAESGYDRGTVRLCDVALGRATSAILSPTSARSLCWQLVRDLEVHVDAVLDAILDELRGPAAGHSTR
jgi:hypothetical protein